MSLLLTVFLYVSSYPIGCQENKENPVSSKAISTAAQSKYGSGDIVYDTYLDRSGTMWFATSQEGIYSFDGNTFTNYTTNGGLCGNEVSSITEDKEGNLWFATDHGLCQYDGTSFETIPLPTYLKQSDWLDSHYPMINPQAASKIYQDGDGLLWIGSNCAGLYTYDGTQFSSYLQEEGALMPDSMHHNAISAVTGDGSGNIWIGSFSHGGITQYSDGRFTKHTLDDGIGDGMISSIYSDREGRLWAGTRNGGIYLYDGNTFKPFSDRDTEDKIAMAKFYQDSKGTLWVSSYARGGIYQLSANRFVPWDIPNSDKLIDVMCMAEDRKGHIWFGGRYGLLWRYDGRVLEDYTYRKKG